jgi:hypothetical protein
MESGNHSSNGVSPKDQMSRINLVIKRLTVFISVIYLFAGHLAAQDLTAKKNETTGKWGFVDKQGKAIIPYKYDYCVEFEDAFKKYPFAVVRVDSDRGLIDKTGKEILPCKYQKIIPMGNEDFSVVFGFSVVFDDRMGFFDVSGKQITPFEYASFAITKDDHSLLGLYQGRWVKINKENGTRID